MLTRRKLSISIGKYMTICLLVTSVLILTPYFSRNAYRELYITFAFVSVPVAIYIGKYFGSKKIPRYLLLLVIWIIYTLFYHFIGLSTTSFGNELGYYSFYFIAITYVVFSNTSNNRERRYLFYGIWITLVINIIINNYELQANLVASTVIMIKGNEYLGTNIGSVVFISTVYLFSLMMLWIGLFSENKLIKILAYISYILAFYLLIFLYRRASTSILFIGFSLVMIFSKMQRTIKCKQRLLLSFLGIIVGIPLAFIIVRSIAESFGITRLADRLDWILQMLGGNLEIGLVGENSLSTRIFLIWGTIKTWFSSPLTFLFGVGDNLRSTSSIAEMFRVTGVGYHSDLIDVLGTHGIIGALIFWGMFRQIYITIKKEIPKVFLNEFKIVYLAFLFCLLMNRTLSGALGIPLFYMLSSMPLILAQNTKE